MKVVVSLGSLVQRAFQAAMVLQELQANRVHQVLQAEDRSSAESSSSRPADSAHPVDQDPTAPKDHQATPVHRADQDLRATPVIRDHKDHRDQEAHQAVTEVQDHEETRASAPDRHRTSRETQARTDDRDHKDQREMTAVQEMTDSPATQDLRDHQAHRDRQVSTDPTETTGNRDLPAHQANGESVRNTAQRMAAFSSRTAQYGSRSDPRSCTIHFSCAGASRITLVSLSTFQQLISSNNVQKNLLHFSVKIGRASCRERV